MNLLYIIVLNMYYRKYVCVSLIYLFLLQQLIPKQQLNNLISMRHYFINKKHLLVISKTFNLKLTGLKVYLNF